MSDGRKFDLGGAEAPDPEVLYFGCVDRRFPGHHLRSKRGDSPRWNSTPWGSSIDGGLLKGEPVVEGRVVASSRDGWTAVTFWDYSGDTRPGSHSIFMAAVTMEPERLLEAAQRQWPEVFSRRGFPHLDLSALRKSGSIADNM